MIRSATALLALSLLVALVAPGAVSAQEPAARTHEVRSGDTLWRLAEQYYEDGHLWRRILEANRDRVDDPADLGVGLVLTIPPLGEVTGVAVETPAAEPEPVGQVPQAEPAPAEPPAEAAPRPELVTQEGRGPRPVERRTAMYPDTVNPAFQSNVAPPLSAVSRDVVYSAPWLVAEGDAVGGAGWLQGFAGAEGEASPRTTARPEDRVLVRFEGGAPPVGSLLQVFRPAREVVDLGTVVEPTGVVRVESIDPAGAVVVVEKLYRRMALGDAVGPMPAYDLSPGQHPEAVSGGAEVEILGFANPRPMYSLGDMVFLDGRAGDARIGDEYVAVFSSGEGWTGDVEARLQIVGVHGDHAVARITAEDSPIVDRNVEVRLDRRMR